MDGVAPCRQGAWSVYTIFLSAAIYTAPAPHVSTDAAGKTIPAFPRTTICDKEKPLYKKGGRNG